MPRKKSPRRATSATELELIWYYNSAPAECGIKSTQAAIQAILESGVLSARGQASDQTERQAAARQRMRSVWRKLATLTERQRRVLETQYSDGAALDRISLGLCAIQPDAIDGHRAACDAVQGKTDVRQLTPAGWVLFLARRELPGLVEILESANRELDAALAAFAGSKP